MGFQKFHWSYSGYGGDNVYRCGKDTIGNDYAEWLEADEAYRTGLVNHVVPQAKFLEFCSGIAQNEKNSPVAIN
jgi:hypothetical protein